MGSLFADSDFKMGVEIDLLGGWLNWAFVAKEEPRMSNRRHRCVALGRALDQRRR